MNTSTLETLAKVPTKKKSNSRWNKGKKRKRDDDKTDVGGPDAGESVKEDIASGARTTKKAKKGATETLAVLSTKPENTGGADSAAKPPERKKAKSAKLEKQSSGDDGDAEAEEGNAEGDEQPSTENAKLNENEKKDRFIVFIGNLPYTTNKAALERHFSSLRPDSIRLITSKSSPNRCKGFAFLEFSAFDRMKSCLERFHHSVFFPNECLGEDGKPLPEYANANPAAAGKKGEDKEGATGPRRINVELTAGGGGKGKSRRERLRVKNEKLGEERRRKRERKEKEEKQKKGEGGGQGDEEGEKGGTHGIHPSRLARIGSGGDDQDDGMDDGGRSGSGGKRGGGRGGRGGRGGESSGSGGRGGRGGRGGFGRGRGRGGGRGRGRGRGR